MEEGTEDKEVHNRGHRLSCHGVDGIPDYGHRENDTKDMGPLQYSGHLQGMTPTVLRLTERVLILVLQTATEKAIKSRYRKLSLQYHPDKVQLDASTNQTLEEVNAFFVEISKAYKALTDEEIRNNYIQYGHPDGKQSFSIGIALPKFIITDGNGKYVLLVYGLLLGLLLPYVVGKWWYGTQRMTKDGVLIASAGNLFKEYKEEITDGGVVTAMSSGEEFKDVLKDSKADSSLGKIERAILADGETAPSAAGLTVKDRQQLEDLEGVRRKTLALLWAYLGRIGLGDRTLDDGKMVKRLLHNRY